jgi:hypothetical protein
MPDLVRGILYDARFIRGHQLQPGWYKLLKVVILVVAIGAYVLLFGWARTAVFGGVFLLLSLVVHFVYRARTDRFTRTWLDFRVEEVDGRMVPVSIGRFYYSAVAINAAVAFAVSQLAGPIWS